MTAITITIIVLIITWGIGTVIRFIHAYSEYAMHRDLINENDPGPFGPSSTFRQWEVTKLDSAKTMRKPHLWPLDAYLSIQKTILQSRKDAQDDR